MAEDKATEVPAVAVAEAVVDPPRSYPFVRVRLEEISEVVVVEQIEAVVEVGDAEGIEDEDRLEGVIKAPGYTRRYLSSSLL